MKKNAQNSSTADHPHLECPYCGQTVMSLRKRVVTQRYVAFTCPFCGCKYKIPEGCQCVQVAVAVCHIVLWGLLYIKLVKPWVAEFLFVNWSVANAGGFINGAAFLLVVVSAIQIMNCVGRKLAYKYPLKKVN